MIIGGGILSDIAAFAASMRQIPIIFVPTTLLAMLDACVGGKTGVNFFPYGKNQLGSFYFPQKVLIYPDWLSSLSDREIHSGASEAIKHALLIQNKNLLYRIIELLKSKDPILWAKDLKELIQVKANIIGKDPYEKNLRMVLNLGHTLAHSLEALSHEHTEKSSILHGEAVAIGLLFILYASLREKSISHSFMLYSKKILLSSQCLLSYTDLARFLGVEDLSAKDLWEKILYYITLDKKTIDHQMQWIVLREESLFNFQKENWVISMKEEHLYLSWLDTIADLKEIA